MQFYLDYSRVLNLGGGSDRAVNPLPQLIYDRNDRVSEEKYMRSDSSMWDFSYSKFGQVFLADVKTFWALMVECGNYKRTLEDFGVSHLVFLSNRFLEEKGKYFLISRFIFGFKF